LAFPTRFSLPPQQVKELISAGAEALASHPGSACSRKIERHRHRNGGSINLRKFYFAWANSKQGRWSYVAVFCKGGEPGGRHATDHRSAGSLIPPALNLARSNEEDLPCRKPCSVR